MDFKFRRGSITANNDIAPVNGIGLNTPEGVKYLSGESGALRFGGEAIGGGGGFQTVTIDEETMTCPHSASEIVAMMQSTPVFVYLDGNYYLPITDGDIVLLSTMIATNAMIICNTFMIGEDKSVSYTSTVVQGQDNN